MKKIIFVVLGVVLGGAAVYFFLTHRGNGSNPSDFVSMAKNGVSENDMLAAIDKANPAPRLSADDVIQLKQAGVSDQVIITLLRKNPPQVAKK